MDAKQQRDFTCFLKCILCKECMAPISPCQPLWVFCVEDLERREGFRIKIGFRRSRKMLAAGTVAVGYSQLSSCIFQESIDLVFLLNHHSLSRDWMARSTFPGGYLCVRSFRGHLDPFVMSVYTDQPTEMGPRQCQESLQINNQNQGRNRSCPSGESVTGKSHEIAV